ncbi:hypothetical protein HK096_008481, partial [Nowakowskiella sp. JEL0078]
MDWKLEDIYNADETGLFYNSTPSSTLSSSGKECGKKQDKTCITILTCASAA